MTALEPWASGRSGAEPSHPLRLLIVLLAAALGVGCQTPPAEQRILETIDTMEAALEAGDIGDFMAPVADDFVGGPALDRRMLGLLVRRERMARERISVSRFDTEVTLSGETRATASFRALATGGSGLLPDEGRVWTIETGWRLDDGEWRLIAADWRSSLGG